MRRRYLVVLCVGALVVLALVLWVLPARPALALRAGSPVQSVAWSPDGARLAAGSDDGRVRVWDVGTRQLLATLDTQSHWVHCLAFSPDGRRLATGDHDGRVRIWEVPGS